MGVHGLWRLIEPSGKPVPLETLENKVLAVDVSIWLHQAIKGFQDSKGQSVPNAHLLSIYHRLCKLLYFKIKPIFVFDGGVPVLKRQTIAKRTQLKVKNVSEADNIQKQLLTVLLKHTAVSKVITEKIEASLASIPRMPSIKSKKDDLFMLPPLNESLEESTLSTSEDEESFSSTTTFDDDDNSPTTTKNWDLHTIEVNSQQFKSLPVDVRHEILTELKGTRKQSSWDRLYELPKESDGFSDYQMKRLLKRQSVQSALEDAEKEMGGKSLSLAELESLLSDQGVIGNEKILGRRIASDENKKYLLVKDVKKAMEEAKIRENIPLVEAHQLVEETTKVDSEDEDLKKAIALSLECEENTSNETQKLRNIPFSLNQELNDDADLSISSSDEDEEIPAKISKTITDNEIREIVNKNLKSDQKKELSKINNLEILDENDENLIEIMSTSEDSEQEEEDQGINILVDPNIKDFNKEDDLFADIFEENNEINQTPLKEKLLEQIINEEKTETVIEVAENSSINESKTSQPELETCSSQKLTENDLKSVKTNLENDMINLQKEKASKERLGVNITDQMYQETQELLELFGVPYVIAPMEAEAQCAFLEEINLTNGTITDDSDIWLFGGRTVYKNFFNQKQYVMEFKSQDIQHSFKLTREKMILLALLVGSDYTVGLTGIGPVTAMEILGTFPCSNNNNLTATTEKEEAKNDELLITGLKEFRSWFLKGKSSGPGRNSLKNKLKNLQFSENFPNLNVVKAYLKPQIETSKETFSWGKPHELALIEFARDKFGWTKLKTEELLKPVLKKLNETQFQKSIKDYFKTDFKESAEAEQKMSKRVKSAISNIGKNPVEILEEDLKNEIKRKPPRQKRKLKDQTVAPEFVKENLTSIEAKIDTVRQRREINQENKAKKIDLKKLKVTSKILVDEDAEVLAKTIDESSRKVKDIQKTMENNLKDFEEKLKAQKPSTSRQSTSGVLQKEPSIPQKNKQEATLLRNKLKAIEIFRKGKNGPGFVRKTEKKKRLPKQNAELSD